MGMFKGKIHWYSHNKNYGYVVDGYGNEYFFHRNGIKKARKVVIETFNPDDEVEFDLIEDDKGKHATNIRIIDRVESYVKRNFKKVPSNNKNSSDKE